MNRRTPPVRVVIEAAPTDQEEVWEWWLIERGSGIGGVANGHGYFDAPDAHTLFLDVMLRAGDSLCRQMTAHVPVELRWTMP